MRRRRVALGDDLQRVAHPYRGEAAVEEWQRPACFMAAQVMGSVTNATMKEKSAHQANCPADNFKGSSRFAKWSIMRT